MCYSWRVLKCKVSFFFQIHINCFISLYNIFRIISIQTIEVHFKIICFYITNFKIGIQILSSVILNTRIISYSFHSSINTRFDKLSTLSIVLRNWPLRSLWESCLHKMLFLTKNSIISSFILWHYSNRWNFSNRCFLYSCSLILSWLIRLL